MRALTYHGTRDVRVDTVPDPKLEQSMCDKGLQSQCDEDRTFKALLQP